MPLWNPSSSAGVQVGPSLGRQAAGVGTYTASTVAHYWLASGAVGDAVWFSLPLNVGDAIGALTCYGQNGNNAGAVFFTVKLFKANAATGTVTQVGSMVTSTGAANGNVTAVISGLSETVVAGVHYFAVWGFASLAAGQRCYAIETTP